MRTPDCCHQSRGVGGTKADSHPPRLSARVGSPRDSQVWINYRRPSPPRFPFAPLARPLRPRVDFLFRGAYGRFFQARFEPSAPASVRTGRLGTFPSIATGQSARWRGTEGGRSGHPVLVMEDGRAEILQPENADNPMGRLMNDRPVPRSPRIQSATEGHFLGSTVLDKLHASSLEAA